MISHKKFFCNISATINETLILLFQQLLFTLVLKVTNNYQQKWPTKQRAVLRKLEFCSISGSQISYLNEHMRKKLNMKTICQERLFIKTFANDSSLFQKLDVVEVNLKTLNKTFNLEVFVWPCICMPIANQQNLTVSKPYWHLWHLKLAHPFDEKHMSIKMLTGIDYYHSFFQEKKIRGNENESVTINPYLGWLVSGSFKHVRFPSTCETNVFFVKNEPFNEVFKIMF